MAILKKGMGPTKKKKKQIVFKNKIETDVSNKNNFGETHEFCFTNMKTVLQKCTKQAPYNKCIIKLPNLCLWFKT